MSAELVALVHITSALLGAIIVLGVHLCVIAWRNKWWTYFGMLVLYVLAIIGVLAWNVLESMP